MRKILKIFYILFFGLNPLIVLSSGYNASFGQALSLDGNGDYVEFGPSPGNLVAHWKFENDLLDSSGNGNHLSYNGAGSPSYLAGDDGSSISFNGSNYVSVSDVPDFNFGSKIMIAGSFQTSYSADSQTIVGQWQTTGNQRAWMVRLNTLGKLEFLVTHTGEYVAGNRFIAISNVSGLNDGSFHRFAILWGAGEFTLFIDGVESSFGVAYSDSSTIYNSTGVMSIGGRPDGLQSFNGRIDDIQLYSGGRAHVTDFCLRTPEV